MPWIFILSIALLLTLINSIGLITGIITQPHGTVYLGTIHYFEDYFLYVNHFFQGGHGAWLTANRYTGEITPPSILYWTDVLMGKIEGLFGLSPIVSYHIGLLILVFAAILTAYILLTRMFPKHTTYGIVAFLFAFLSTSFMNHIYVNDTPMWYPFQLWRTPHFAFDRLGGVPHQILQSLLFFLLTIMCFDQSTKRRTPKLCIIIFLAFTLTSLNPIQAAIFLAAFLATEGIVFLQKKSVSVSVLLAVTVTVGCTFAYLYTLFLTLPHAQVRTWEATQQTHSTFPFLLASIGPMSLFLLLGIIPSLVSGNALFLFGTLLVTGTYAVFLSSVPQMTGIPNLRVIFPALYPFMGAIAVQGILLIAKKISRYVRVLTTVSIVTIVFLLLSLPTLFWELRQKMDSQKNTRDATLYLPSAIYGTFSRLQSIGHYNDVVLANPATHMDSLIPALSGHTTYSGHMLLTIRSEEKKASASQFFLLQKTDTESWLKANNIRYILFTEFDANSTQFIDAYPFLKTVYESGGNRIFLVQ